MTRNALKRRLLDRETVYGCWLSLGSTFVTEALSHAGFDFLVVDAEHSPIDGMDVAALLQAAGNGAAAPVVRVSENAPMLVKRAMDAGCATIVFPAVNDATEARRAVMATRYPPAGVRGVAGGVRATKFGMDRDYLACANDDACAIVQIETAAGLANVEAIAAVDGVDALFVGPADLSASLGHLGNSEHPEVQAALTRVAQVAARFGKSAGIFATSAELARGYRVTGYNLIAVAADIVWLMNGAREALALAKR
jgi:2-dehydro-3-deoxyglucarate aldolase